MKVTSAGQVFSATSATPPEPPQLPHLKRFNRDSYVISATSPTPATSDTPSHLYGGGSARETYFRQLYVISSASAASAVLHLSHLTHGISACESYFSQLNYISDLSYSSYSSYVNNSSYLATSTIPFLASHCLDPPNPEGVFAYVGPTCSDAQSFAITARVALLLPVHSSSTPIPLPDSTSATSAASCCFSFLTLATWHRASFVFVKVCLQLTKSSQPPHENEFFL